VVTGHVNLVHLLKQSSDKLADRETHWVEKIMPYASLMRNLYMKGILNEADPVSRRPDFLPVNKVRGLDEILWWDGNVLDIDTNGNDHALMALSISEILHVIYDDFLSKLKGAYSSCNYLSNENIESRLRQQIEKSSDGLNRHHNRVVIPRPASALIEELSFEYHDNVGHPKNR